MIDSPRESMDTAVAEDTHLGLRIAAPVLVAGLALEVVAHALGTWGPPATFALASLLLTAPVAVFWHRHPQRVEQADAGVAFVISVLIVNAVAHLTVASVAGKEVFLSFGIAATGAFVLSRAWLVPMLAGQFVVWLLLIGARGQLVVMPITLTMLAVAIHVARRRAIQTAHTRQLALETANANLSLAQEALDHAGDPILWIATGGAITYANRAASQLLGYPASDIVRMRIGDIDLRAQTSNRPTPAAGPDSVETTYRGQDGALYPVEVHSRQVTVNGQPFSCVIARDLTQRRRIEEKLRLAQRLESLGLLAGGLAHDFNNLLMAIVGNADLARAAVAEDSPARPLLDQVLGASERATLLTRQLLAYAGGSVVDTQKLDLAAEIAEVAHLLEISLPKGVRLELDLAPGLPAVAAPTWASR